MKIGKKCCRFFVRYGKISECRGILREKFTETSADFDRGQLENTIITHFSKLVGEDLKITYYDNDMEMDLDVASNTKFFHKAMIRGMYAGGYL